MHIIIEPCLLSVHDYTARIKFVHYWYQSFNPTSLAQLAGLALMAGSNSGDSSSSQVTLQPQRNRKISATLLIIGGCGLYHISKVGNSVLYTPCLLYSSCTAPPKLSATRCAAMSVQCQLHGLTYFHRLAMQSVTGNLAVLVTMDRSKAPKALSLHHIKFCFVHNNVVLMQLAIAVQPATR
jgi:hypothetical protein